MTTTVDRRPANVADPEARPGAVTVDQYSRRAILAIWAAAAFPTQRHGGDGPILEQAFDRVCSRTKRDLRRGQALRNFQFDDDRYCAIPDPDYHRSRFCNRYQFVRSSANLVAIRKAWRVGTLPAPRHDLDGCHVGVRRGVAETAGSHKPRCERHANV